MSIKFCVVGFGHIGRRHAKIVEENPSTRMVAVVDIDESLNNLESLDIKVPFFTSLNSFLKSGIEADVITIATPNGFHCSLALDALEAGFHVVIEKPMGLSKIECEEVIFKSLKADKKVFVVKQNRYSPPVKWMKDIVTQKIVGDILMAQINCYWNRDDRYYEPGNWKGTKELDGGVLFTQFSHFIDIMHWVFGDIKNIKANFANFMHQESTQFDDSGFVNFVFVNGGIGSLNFSTTVWDKNMESSMTVIGSKGSLKIGGQYMDRVEYCHISGYTLPILPATNPPNNYGIYTGSAANHHYVIENIINTLLYRGTIDTNAMEGLKVVEIIERIYNS